MIKFEGRAKPDEEHPEGRLLSYFPGVPARDLDEDDWAALDKDTRKAVLASGLYKDTSKPAAKKVEDVTPVQTLAKDKSA